MRRFSGEEEGYIYSLWGNPTMTEAEKRIEALESFRLTDKNNSALQVKGILHASGMAAISTLMLATLKPGDKILTHFSLYGDRKSTRLNSSHIPLSRMPSSA